jgi:acylphosphatase
METADRSVKLAIRGRVQGVGYRAFVHRTAVALGLSGWVRNRPDGSVEAVLAGPRDAVEDMIARCRTGPRAAKVTGLDVVPADIPAPGFEVRPTG